MFLLAIILILGITAYKRSFSLAIDAYENYKEAQVQLVKYSTANEKLNFLTNEIVVLDQIIGKQTATPIQVQQQILEFQSKNAFNAKLVTLEKVHKSSNDYFMVYTNQLSVQGGVNDLLGLTYDFEKDFDFSRIVGLTFKVIKDKKTKKNQLIEKIIFQNYEKLH